MLKARYTTQITANLAQSVNSSARFGYSSAYLRLQKRLLNTAVTGNEKILFEDLRNNTRNYDENELKAQKTLNTNTSAQKQWSTYKLPSKNTISLQEKQGNEKQEQNKTSFEETDKNTVDIKPTPKFRRSAMSASSSSASRISNRRKNRQKTLKAPITLLPNALLHLKQLNNQPTPKFIKIGVTSRGCSGLSYDLQYVTEANKYDEIVEQDGVKIIIDSKALLTIIGSEMDWVDDKLSNRFVFKNPNSKGTCGCGESFHV